MTTGRQLRRVRGKRTQTAGLTWFLGVDWGRVKHRVCLLAADGTVVTEQVVVHTAAALAAMVQALRTVTAGPLAAVGVALEATEGPVVETLRAAGCRVFVVSPAQMRSLRQQLSVAGAKDDRRDAYVLAETLRTAPHVPAPLAVPRAAQMAVREHSRALQELTLEVARAVQRWSHQLARYYPQFLAVAGDALDRPWAWELWELAPTPAAAQGVRRGQLTRLLKRHRARQQAAAVLAALQAPGFAVAAGVPEGAVVRIQAILPLLKVAGTQARAYAGRLPKLTAAALPAATADPARPTAAAIVRSLPGAGPRITAALAAEAPDALLTADYARLRLAGGVAPVTAESGKRRTVQWRRAHNQRLGTALFHLARGAVQRDAHWRAQYTAARARGQRHGRALRGIADRLLAVLCALLRTGTLYDPNHARRGAPTPQVA